MSRLVFDDIKHICGSVEKYDAFFRKQTGKSMAETVRYALGISKEYKGIRTAVIPVTSGLGIINSFSESVCAILEHIGADVFVTENTDVAGIREAYMKNAEVIFMADDDAYIAFSVNKCIVSDNGYATGMSFAAALELSIGNDNISPVLVLGCGPVGKAAAEYLAKKRKVFVYDPCISKTAVLSDNENIRIHTEMPDLHKYKYILDATPSGDWINSDMINEETVFSVPGMPLSLTEKAVKISELIHNPLELGTIAMYYDCVSATEVS